MSTSEREPHNTEIDVSMPRCIVAAAAATGHGVGAGGGELGNDSSLSMAGSNFQCRRQGNEMGWSFPFPFSPVC